MSSEVQPHNTRVIKTAVLVTGETRPKDLSNLLDWAFEDCDAVLQFVVEGCGWTDAADATEAALMDMLVTATAERLCCEGDARE